MSELGRHAKLVCRQWPLRRPLAGAKTEFPHTRKAPQGAGRQPQGRTREEQADSRGTWRHARWRQEPRARQGRGAGTEGQEVTPAAASRPREQSGDRQTLTQFQETDSRKFRFALRGAVWVAGKQRSIFAATRHGALGHGALRRPAGKNVNARAKSSNRNCVHRFQTENPAWRSFVRKSRVQFLIKIFEKNFSI